MPGALVWATSQHYLGCLTKLAAFVAGVALAASPIARFIAERLHAIRDFFLVLFFVAVGAHFDSGAFADVVVPSLVLALLVLAIKPVAYRYFFGLIGEKSKTGWECGFRLGTIE